MIDAAQMVLGRKMSAREAHDIYLRYLAMKVYERDWHGVADAAMDLRELEARNPGLRSAK